MKYCYRSNENNSKSNRGVLPFSQRRKIWDKYRTKARKQKTNNLNSDIVVGSQVCMKNSPLYQPGAIGMLIVLKASKYVLIYHIYFNRYNFIWW